MADREWGKGDCDGNDELRHSCFSSDALPPPDLLESFTGFYGGGELGFKPFELSRPASRR
jgi:hypothetical protein